MTRAANALQTHGWWLASRASGLVALVLVTVSVGLGLTMAGKVMRRPGLSRKLLAIHEQTALAGLVAIAVHGITLLGDPWLNPGVAGVTVPFAMGFRTALHRARHHRRLPGGAARPQLLRPPADRRRGSGARPTGATVLVYAARPRPRARRRHRRLGRLVPLVGDRDRAADRRPLRLPGAARPAKRQARGSPRPSAPCRRAADGAVPGPQSSRRRDEGRQES